MSRATRVRPPATALCVALGLGLGLSACGSAGSPGGITASAPVVPAVPTAYAGATAAYVPVRDSQSVGPLGAAGDLELTITEPDAPVQTRFDQVNFTGNETIRVRVASTGYDQTFTHDNFQGPSTSAYLDPAQVLAARNLEVTRWSIPVGSENSRLRIYKLSEGPDVGSGVINPLEFVRVGEIRGTTAGTYFLFGQQTAATDMARTGTLRYDGEVVGQYFTQKYPTGRDYISQVALSVDFGRASSQVVGNTYNVRFLDTSFDDRPSPGFQVALEATISGSTFSGTAVATDDLSTMTGPLTGAFYGSSATPADEIAGLFAVTAPGRLNRIVGGFAAGR